MMYYFICVTIKLFETYSVHDKGFNKLHMESLNVSRIFLL